MKFRNGQVNEDFVYQCRKHRSFVFKKSPSIRLQLYVKQLEQVKVIRYLGVWLDTKLIFAIHIQKKVDKCKNVLNILRCLAGVDWGARRHSLKKIYCALIRSTIDYGCIA